MPLIGIYRGRDKTDTVFKTDYQLTLLPIAPNAGGAIQFFTQVFTTQLNFNADAAQTIFSLFAPTATVATQLQFTPNTQLNDQLFSQQVGTTLAFSPDGNT